MVFEFYLADYFGGLENLANFANNSNPK